MVDLKPLRQLAIVINILMSIIKKKMVYGKQLESEPAIRKIAI